MHRSRLIYLLLTPSLTSSLVCLGIALFMLTVSGWSYIVHSELFYDYLFGPHGIQTALVQAPDSLAAVRSAMFDSPAAYYVLLVVVALALGILALELLQWIQTTVHTAGAVWRGTGQSRSLVMAELRDLGSRAGLRVLILVGWAIYISFFVYALVPFSTLLAQIGIDDISNSAANGWWYASAAVILLFVSLHMHVIFARLFTQRLRILKGWNVLLSE